jgi:glyoxylase-like metal-dependent hydrolase (beta-lactamase superfamily II)
LKGVVEGLTDLPYDVALTHGHPDHAGGIGQFNTVYIHTGRYGNVSAYSLRAGYNMEKLCAIWQLATKMLWGYTEEDVTPYTRMPEIKLLADNQVFDLGGRKVTVYYAPGHSPVHVHFLTTGAGFFSREMLQIQNVGTSIAVSTTHQISGKAAKAGHRI